MFLVLPKNITIGNGHKLQLEMFGLDTRKAFSECVGNDCQKRGGIPILKVF